MNDQEILNVMTLTLLPKLGSSNAKILYETFGSATELFNNIGYIKDYLPNASELLIKTLSSHTDYLPRAEKELKFADEKRIRCLSIGDSDYPQRLKDCSDAPLLIYYKGNASLTPPKSISIVGTRHCTEYGKELCRRFVSDLREAVPDVQIISGLAYGIDIEAHRNALDSGLDTIGVLAHGLDQIYPSSHRSTAIKMLGQGGLVTEYMSGTNADKFNFVKRNRIVAGLADVTVIIESKNKGGSLITADIAESYNRDVCAFPGRVTDENSAGCNRLIQENHANMITCADDLVKLMRWNARPAKKKSFQQELFIELSENEQAVCNVLKDCDSKQINQIAVETNIPVHEVSVVLFELEMKGVTKCLNGGNYRLIRL